MTFILCKRVCILWNVFPSPPRPRRVSHLPRPYLYSFLPNHKYIYTHMPEGKVVSYTIIFVVTLEQIDPTKCQLPQAPLLDS